MTHTLKTLLAAAIVAASSSVALADDTDKFGIFYPSEFTSSDSSYQQMQKLTPGVTVKTEEKTEFGIHAPENDIYNNEGDG